jgi:[ribosomal protein S5]-alanine N-acetyltransferase
MKGILQTERLSLRAWTPDDAEALFAICGDAEVMLHIGAGKPFESIYESLRFVDWAVAHQNENGFSRWAVVEKAAGEIIGSCGLARLADSGEIELGYLFAKHAWGKGYATEASAACLRYGFEQMRLTEVIALTDPGHVASQRVLEKLGFARRGIGHYGGEDSMVYVRRAADSDT